MSLPKLDNLVRAGQLKAEPRNEAEARRMLATELIADVAKLVDTR